MADALWMNCPPTGGPQYTAAELRQDMSWGVTWGGRDLGGRQGARPGGTQWNVTLSASTLTVRAGVGIIDPGLTTSQGPYWVALPADETHTLVPAHATSPRKDIVVVRVYDHDEDGSGLRLARSEYLPGVAGPSPSEPATPAGALRIASVDVPAQGGGNPVVTINAPWSVGPGGVLPVRNATEQAAVVPYPGMVLAPLQTAGALLVWNGAAWVPVANSLATLTPSMANKRILSGRYAATASSGSSHSVTAISFGATFPSPPNVVITQVTHSANPIWYHIEGHPTATGFSIAVGKVDGSNFGSTVNYNFDWLAIG